MGLAEAVSRDEFWLDAGRDHVSHNVLSPFLRQDEISSNPLFRQVGANRRRPRVAVDDNLCQLVRREDRCDLGTALLRCRRRRSDGPRSGC